MVRIGVFGLMGSGKSTVAGWFRDWGASVVDGDALGWETLREPDIVAALGEAFGREALAPDGSVDRATLGRRVFGDRAAMDRLNAIVQPRLLGRVREAIARAPRSGGPVVLDAAMLTTWGLEPELDGVVHVRAGESARRERVERSRSLTRSDAEARVRGQRLPDPKGAARVWTIENDGDLAALRRRAEDVWREIEAMARA